jgi:competence protein ComEA
MGVLPERPAPTVAQARWRSIMAWVHWFGPGRVAAMAMALVVLGGTGWWMVWPAGGGPSPVPSASTQPGPPDSPDQLDAARSDGFTLVTTPTTPSPVTEVLVHVAGAVQRPGVYRLEPGDRVIDAVTAAGGATPEAVVHAVNLAAPLSDGQRVHIPIEGEPIPPEAVSPSASPAAAAMISVNTATEAELVALSGVGPVLAAAIVAHRDAHGPFTTIDALLAVPGVGPAKLEALRAQATL